MLHSPQGRTLCAKVPGYAFQDANWRELLRFCFARGAYRGAGVDLLSTVTRSGDTDDGGLFGVTTDRDGMQALLMLRWP